MNIGAAVAAGGQGARPNGGAGRLVLFDLDGPLVGDRAHDVLGAAVVVATPAEVPAALGRL